MKPQIKTYTTLVLAALTTLANATTALIDFGRADSAAPAPLQLSRRRFWNDRDVTLIDTDSLPTDWTVSVTENGSGNGGSAGGGADVTGFPAELASSMPPP